ncbi:MAG: protein kinase domain-containing protein [Gemmataceae bacterium]
MSSPQFLIVGGPDKDRIFPVHPGANQLGRHQDATYKLNDPRVSRFHCEIKIEGDKVSIKDLGGSGGVLVNGQKVTEHTLRGGDLVQVGETLMRFQHPQQAAAAASTMTNLSQPAEHDPQAVAQLAELSGRKLNRFEIGKVIGQGDSAMVFQAVDTGDGDTVALKVMLPEFSKDPDEMERFVRAMKTMMPLKHPNLIRLHGAGKNGPYCWVAMDFIDGETMTAVIKRIGIAGMLDWKYAFKVGVHIGRALDYAHGQNIIHRNVTPPNIFLRAADKVVLLGDLMLAKALEGSLAKQVTKPGELLGDVNYLSPERTRSSAEGVDGRSDLFSLGATMYALLTGKAPFAGTTLIETITRIRQAEPLKPTTFQLGIPGLFEAAVMKMLAKRPDDRFQSAGEMVAELERIGKYNGVTV